MNRVARSLGLLALASACASVPSAEDRKPAPRVRGVVLLDGQAPAARHWPLEDAMREVAGIDEYVDETWLVAPDGGLANCVITLEPLEGDPPAVAPMEVAYEKIGPRYEPRVLVATRGSQLTLRNVDSPCNGFMCRSPRLSFNMTLQAGSEHVVALERSALGAVACDLRPYMRGAIHVVDTPWYALSSKGGRFAIEGVPDGRYRVRVWHEVVGFLEDVPELTLAGDEPAELTYRIPAPE